MNENIKTSIFVAIAAAAVLIAFITRPSLPVSDSEDLVNQPLFPNFTDPLAVTSLKIVEFDDQRGEVIPFQVAQVDVKGKKRWSIPSHEDYPADAKDQVASAATGLAGLKILEKVSENQGDQREYGVIDPDPKTLKAGDTGVGMRVLMKDDKNKELLSLIVGKEVPGKPNLRYVRKVGQAPIYIVEAKTDKLTTKFENWIERNLLGINSMDIKMVWIRDYSVDEFNGTLNQRGDMQLDHDYSADPKWKLADDRKYVADKDSPAGRWEPVKMAPDEELNTAKLDELRTALDDLKIENISRKPAGLSTDLKAAADFARNRQAVESLAQKGFFMAKLEDQAEPELLSNDGEIRILMNDGVNYVLRFGEIAGKTAKKDDKNKKKGTDPGKDKKDADKKDVDKKDAAGVNRYLFVMTEYDPNIIPKPKLEPLPDVKEKKADDKKPADKKATDKKTDDTKAGDKKADDAQKALLSEREKIEKENKRKQDEYERKLAAGRKRAAELNARFSDWYYVISDDVYRKIRLSRGDIVKKKEKQKPGEPSAQHPAAELKDMQEAAPAVQPQ